MSNTIVTSVEFDRAMIIETLRKDNSLLLVDGCEWFDMDHGSIVTTANNPFKCVGIVKDASEIVLMVTPDQFGENILFWSMIQNEFDEFRRVDYTKGGIKCQAGEADLISFTLSSLTRPELFERIVNEAKECADFEKSMGL